VREAGVRHEPEDFVVHGDDLRGRRWSPRGNGWGGGGGGYLIIPEEPRVDGGAVIFVKEVCESLEDIVTLEGLEQAKDDIEVSGPATADADDWLSAQTCGLTVL